MKTYYHQRSSVTVGTVTASDPGGDPDVTCTDGQTLNFVLPRGATGPAMQYSDLTDDEKNDIRTGITLDAIGLTAITDDEIEEICT